MMTTPPRSEDHNPTPEPVSTPPLVTWCTWRGTAGPPPVLGHTDEDAASRLLDYLTHYFAKEAELPCKNPRSRARQESVRYMDLGLACFVAPDETTAFRLWVEVSSLSAEEALLRWRAAFSWSGGDDPLRDLACAMDLAARAVGPARTRRLPRAATARITLLGRFLFQLPRLSDRRIRELREQVDAPQG